MHNVLLVDDEAMVRIGVKTCVKWGRLGIGNVYEASNGMEALKIMDAQKIDIVITDIKMSVMDGFVMLEELTRRETVPKVIVMSCYNDYENMRRAISYGVKDFLFKPKMYPKDIEEAIRKLQDTNAEQEEQLDIVSVIGSITEENYVSQFQEMYHMYRQHDMEMEEYISCFVEFLNKMMEIDDATDPTLHIFNTILFQSLCELRKCRDKNSLLAIMSSILNRVEQGENQEIKEEMYKALQFIDLHLSDVNLTQEMTAEYVGLSVSYFCRLFKRKLGLSYSGYIIKKRIELAENLYMTTNMRIADIAQAVGYTNERYFARLYKEYRGKSMKHTLQKESEND